MSTLQRRNSSGERCALLRAIRADDPGPPEPHTVISQSRVLLVVKRDFMGSLFHEVPYTNKLEMADKLDFLLLAGVSPVKSRSTAPITPFTVRQHLLSSDGNE